MFKVKVMFRGEGHVQDEGRKFQMLVRIDIVQNIFDRYTI